jgi:hypothetical protein
MAKVCDFRPKTSANASAQWENGTKTVLAIMDVFADSSPKMRFGAAFIQLLEVVRQVKWLKMDVDEEALAIDFQVVREMKDTDLLDAADVTFFKVVVAPQYYLAVLMELERRMVDEEKIPTEEIRKEVIGLVV